MPSWAILDHHTAADHIANCVLESRRDVDTLNKEVCQSFGRDVVGLQIFCDGGYAAGCGAAAFVVTSVHDVSHAGDRALPTHHRRMCSLERAKFESRLLGSQGMLIEEASSAFHAETTALDVATEWLASIFPELFDTFS